MTSTIASSIATTPAFSTSDEEAPTRTACEINVEDNHELSPLPVPMETDDRQPSMPVSDDEESESPSTSMARSRRHSRGATTPTATPSESADAARDTEDEIDEDGMEPVHEGAEPEQRTSEEEEEAEREEMNEASREIEREKSTTDSEMNDDEEEAETEEEIVQNTSLNAPLSNKDKLINIGADFQAILPSLSTLEAPKEKRLAEKDRDQQIWDCKADVKKEELDSFILEATGRYTVPIDRALYILTKCDYNMEKAVEECSQRHQLRQVWTKEEKSLFQQAIHRFPKKFKKIQETMPQRSLSSIIQFYYDTKQEMDYKKYFDDDGTIDPYDEVMEEMRKNEKLESGTCENCAEQAEVMIFNRQLQRNECKPCVLFFRIMHRPRPAHLSAQEELRKTMAICPEYMRTFVNGSHDLQAPADGKAWERFGFGEEYAPVQEEEDDDIQILDPTSTECPSGPYKAVGLGPDEVVDENTCRMTRTFDDVSLQKALKSIRQKFKNAIPVVWRVMENKCMEDIRFLNDESRKMIGKAYSTWDKVPHPHVSKMKEQMAKMRQRCGENFFDPTEDIPESSGAASRSGRVRCDSNWTPREKKDCVRCFHWYHTDFKTISEILGTKSAEHVEEFYEKHKEVIEKSIEAYREEVRSKNGV